MCDHSGKLVAFLDQELDHAEVARLEQHLKGCADCRQQLSRYEQASNLFHAYCDAALVAAQARRERRRWMVPVISGAAVAALAAGILLFFLHPKAKTPSLPGTAKTAPPAAFETAPPLAPPLAPGTPLQVHRRRVPPPTRRELADWVPAEPAIEIAIPADAMFPPGAVPDGLSFTADVSFAPDGSAQQMRLRPRLVNFERGAPQP
jgi:hypothetical protein